MNEEQSFTLALPTGLSADRSEGWIGVLAGHPKPVPYPFSIRIGYSERGQLVCRDLRIGDTAGVATKPRRNVTKRMLVGLPLGEVLRFIQSHRAHSNPVVREVLGPLAETLAVPPEGRFAESGAHRKPDEFYIHQAELFAREYVRSSRGHRELYERLAAETHFHPATFRRHVQRGWELRPGLKPEGVRTRKPRRKEER